MEEVRFEDYKGRERQTTRFFHDEKEREEMPLLAKAGIGIAVAAGILTTGHRTGAMRKIARFLDTEGKATIQAFREIRDESGSLFHGNDKLTTQRMKNLKDSFVKRRTDIRDELARGRQQSNILESRDFRIAKELEKRKNLIGQKHGEENYSGELAYNIREGYRFAAIMDDIRQTTHMQNQPNVMEELEKAVAKGDLGILDRGTKEQMELLLKEHGKGVDNEDVLNILEEARDKYKGRDFSPQRQDAFRMIEGIQEKVAQSTAELMPNATSADSVLKNFMIGHKQATVNDILEMHNAGRIRVNADLRAQIDDVMQRNTDFGSTVFDENLYLNTKNGELFDYKVFSDMKRNTAEWWANTIPGGLLHLRDILNVKQAREAHSMKIFQRGTIMSALNGHRGIDPNEALNEEVLFMYGKFVRVNDVDAINSDTALNILNKDRDMYLTSSQFGTTGKMFRHMSGNMTDNDSPRNLVAEIFDVGNQDKDSVGVQGVSVFTKFFNKNWERNRIKHFMKNGFESPEELFEMNTHFKLNTKGFSPRVLNNLKDQLPKEVRDHIDQNDLNFSRDEDMLSLFKFIGEKEKNKKGSMHTELQNLFRQFNRDPDRVLNRKTPVGESNPILGHHTQVKTGQDEINQQVSLYLVNEMLMKGKGNHGKPYVQLATNFRTSLKGMHHNGEIFREDLEQAEQLLNFSIYRSQIFNVFEGRDGALSRANTLFTTNQPFQESMRSMARRTNPMWERFSNTKPENRVGDELIAINKSSIGNVFGWGTSTTERWQGVKNLAKELSPFTGRRNMQDVTTLTMYGNYYPVYRLQDALGNAGLGFSDASMGNAFQMFNALMFKRIAPVYLGIEGAKYASYETDKLTGEGIDERWENYKANNRLENAMTRTEFEIAEKKRERMLKPGLEHWTDMPSIHLPGIGPVSAGDLLNNTLGRIYGDKVTLRDEDLMTYDETMDDLYNGEEEIRKSRYWFAGSKTAYRGGRVTEFAPNSFRQAHSDSEYTNTSATGEEYWGNHILPTFENPLGGLSFLFGNRDPYWYERKHYYDRPYMLTGELFNPNTMVLGDIGNATIGKLIKPVQEMHPEYWGDPRLIYENETDNLGERPDEPVRTRVSPAGRVENDVLADAEEYGASRYYVTDEYDQKGNATGAYVAQDMETNQAMYVPANIAKEKLPVGQMFQMAQTPTPQGSYVKAVAIPSNNQSYQAQVSTQPRGMMDEEYAYKQDIMYRKMANIKDPRDGSWRLQEGIENWTEPLGIYKWIVNDELLGRDPYGGETVVQRADAAYNASNRFWESELGSLGGQMSEIGRRFIRRDDGQLDTYNPIRNTMPDWMPGDGYFINFQIGDPYSKLPNGERRLPGEAYESLNELHPDETGRYGAFDKFKILADAAPFSDEYNFWSQYLLDTLPEGDLRKEATQIRKQVSQRRQKYDFTPYRFKGNNIVYDEVTVDKFLDDYTFTTKELGDQAIRIAGMEYRKKAGGVLQNYFQSGDKVTIGIAEDPDKRISQDTYGTMRAVIFNELGNINKDIIERGRMAENQNDFSAAGIHARFTPQEIKKGARWETLAHTSSPLNTKFLQVRSALEEYERDQVYGKDWATWDNFMLNDYIVPTLQGLGRFDNPLWSAGAGATTGLVLGRFFLKGGRTTKVATVAGALFGLGSNLFFKRHENKYGESWIPERRQKENEINEYFDILKYMKYEGLYQKAREEIAHQTGYDVEEFATIIEDQKELTKQKRKELEEEKKRLYTEQPKGWEDKRKEINTELETISQNFQEMYLPDAFLQALSYKEERDTTLYGVDPYEDRMKVMKAFPYKDKYFFQEFLNASADEKEKILKLVPENQRRVYKALWGMGLDEQKPLEHYMEKYNIPNWDWEGWKPEYNLEDIKVKTVQEAGLDLSDFNFWEDDIMASQYVPDLQEGGGNSYQGEPSSSFRGFNALRQNIVNILQGQGLYDVQVTVTPSDGAESQANVTYTEDRSGEIQEHLRQHGSRYV